MSEAAGALHGKRKRDSQEDVDADQAASKRAKMEKLCPDGSCDLCDFPDTLAVRSATFTFEKHVGAPKGYANMAFDATMDQQKTLLAALRRSYCTYNALAEERLAPVQFFQHFVDSSWTKCVTLKDVDITLWECYEKSYPHTNLLAAVPWDVGHVKAHCSESPPPNPLPVSRTVRALESKSNVTPGSEVLPALPSMAKMTLMKACDMAAMFIQVCIVDACVHDSDEWVAMEEACGRDVLRALFCPTCNRCAIWPLQTIGDHPLCGGCVQSKGVVLKAAERLSAICTQLKDREQSTPKKARYTTWWASESYSYDRLRKLLRASTYHLWLYHQHADADGVEDCERVDSMGTARCSQCSRYRFSAEAEGQRWYSYTCAGNNDTLRMSYCTLCMTSCPGCMWGVLCVTCESSLSPDTDTGDVTACDEDQEENTCDKCGVTFCANCVAPLTELGVFTCWECRVGSSAE